MLTRKTKIIYLSVKKENLFERLQSREDRALAKSWSVSEFEKKLKERLAVFEKLTYEINADGQINFVGENLFKLVCYIINKKIPYEFWFRSNYEQDLRIKKCIKFFRPGDRSISKSKGIFKGADVRLRILEEIGTPDNLPKLTDFYKNAKIKKIEVKKIADLRKVDFNKKQKNVYDKKTLKQEIFDIYKEKIW